ncbi:hypothetical protein BC936DRAFT_144581, partial [Jimgerdemannia flammicorona]
ASHPQKVLEQTVLAELTLTQTLSRYHREKGWYSSVYDDDTPELLKDVVTQLQNALKLELSPKAKVVPMAAMQKEFATIILARAHFESGTYAKTLELLDTTNVPLERASTGYAFVLLIMSKTIKVGFFETDVASLEGLFRVRTLDGAGEGGSQEVPGGEVGWVELKGLADGGGGLVDVAHLGVLE